MDGKALGRLHSIYSDATHYFARLKVPHKHKIPAISFETHLASGSRGREIPCSRCDSCWKTGWATKNSGGSRAVSFAVWAVRRSRGIFYFIILVSFKSDAHLPAKFIHQGVTFLVKEVSHDSKMAKLIRADVNWTTEPRWVYMYYDWTWLIFLQGFHEHRCCPDQTDTRDKRLAAQGFLRT